MYWVGNDCSLLWRPYMETVSALPTLRELPLTNRLMVVWNEICQLFLDALITCVSMTSKSIAVSGVQFNWFTCNLQMYLRNLIVHLDITDSVKPLCNSIYLNKELFSTFCHHASHVATLIHTRNTHLSIRYGSADYLGRDFFWIRRDASPSQFNASYRQVKLSESAIKWLQVALSH